MLKKTNGCTFISKLTRWNVRSHRLYHLKASPQNVIKSLQAFLQQSLARTQSQLHLCTSYQITTWYVHWPFTAPNDRDLEVPFSLHRFSYYYLDQWKCIKLETSGDMGNKIGISKQEWKTLDIQIWGSTHARRRKRKLLSVSQNLPATYTQHYTTSHRGHLC